MKTEQMQEIEMLYKTTRMVQREIAAKVGVSITTVSRLAKNHNWKREAMPDETKDFDALKAKASVLYIQHGLSVQRISKRLQVSISAVTKWATNWVREVEPVNVKSWEATHFEASVQYIKNGLSLKSISGRLRVSMPTLSKWRVAGRWDELRPDMDVMNEYKAAAMYIKDQMSIGEICMRLNVPEAAVNYWGYLNGWDTPRNLAHVQDATAEIVNCFSTYFKSLFPQLTTEIDLVEQDFIKSIASKK